MHFIYFALWPSLHVPFFIVGKFLIVCGQVVDLISAVKELHGLTSQELNKLIRDSENFTIHFQTEKGSQLKVRKQNYHHNPYAFLFANALYPKWCYFSDWCGKTGRLSSFASYSSACVIQQRWITVEIFIMWYSTFAFPVRPSTSTY